MAEDFKIQFDTASTRLYLDKMGLHATDILALALTLTALDAKAQIKARLPTIFDRPTRYTLNSLQVEYARGIKLVSRYKRDTNLAAWVGYKEFAGRYLSPQVVGGHRRDKGTERMLRARGFLPANMQVVPAKGAELNKFGNMNQGQLIKMLSSVRAFSEVGYFANKRADGVSMGKRANEHYFLANSFTPRTAHLSPGIYQYFPETWFNPKKQKESRLKGRIVPALAFVQTPTYRPRFDIEGIVEATMNERLMANLNKAAKEAMASGGLVPRKKRAVEALLTR